jgi:hypothetical protein
MRKALQLLLVGVVVLAGLGVASAPSQARSLSDCPGSTNTCGWILTNFSGTPGFINTMPGTFGACVNVAGFSKNNIESVLNENSFQVSFYDDDN